MESGYPVLSGQVRLRVGRHTLDLEAQVPDAPVHLDEMLPLWRLLTDAMVAVGTSDAQDQGEKIRCTKGCGACCNQLVPITLPEAFALTAMMETWPEERRRTVTARFERIVSELVTSGWLARWNDMLENRPAHEKGEHLQLGLDYFRLGQPCPFLEEQACSIYHERPLICRQFLALSDPVHCLAPSAETVRTVRLPFRPNNLLGSAAVDTGYSAAFIPLTLMPAFMATHPARGTRQHGKLWAEHLFRAVSRKDLPPETPLHVMGA